MPNDDLATHVRSITKHISTTLADIKKNTSTGNNILNTTQKAELKKIYTLLNTLKKELTNAYSPTTTQGTLNIKD